MKTTWRVIDKNSEVVFIGPNGWYNEAEEYIKEHSDEELELDPDMK